MAPAHIGPVCTAFYGMGNKDARSEPGCVQRAARIVYNDAATFLANLPVFGLFEDPLFEGRFGSGLNPYAPFEGVRVHQLLIARTLSET